jgi:hypothetical protein
MISFDAAAGSGDEPTTSGCELPVSCLALSSLTYKL